MPKGIAYYKSLLTDVTVGGCVMLVRGEHHRLGGPPEGKVTRTSPVNLPKNDKGVFETENTIWAPEPPSENGQC